MKATSMRRTPFQVLMTRRRTRTGMRPQPPDSPRNSNTRVSQTLVTMKTDRAAIAGRAERDAARAKPAVVEEAAAAATVVAVVNIVGSRTKPLSRPGRRALIASLGRAATCFFDVAAGRSCLAGWPPLIAYCFVCFGLLVAVCLIVPSQLRS